MKRVTRNSVIAVAAASGAMAMAAPVYADSAADGAAAGSRGVVSGNTVQIPVHLPVNVCGNTVNVVGLLNPAVGNRCANESGDSKHEDRAGHHGREEARGGGATAHGATSNSSGIASGNDIQIPVHLPVNVSGNSVNVVGIGNPAEDNSSTNGEEPEDGVTPSTLPAPSAPPRSQPAPKPHPAPQAEASSSLAHTGADQALPTIAAGAALVLGGATLYRRFRPGASR
ncbi:chaplin family protein [Streptomyces sp. NPDC046831]|uniref:chaplin family protein n=1 Tax=Streptomyces sp. NPDC046831 TaxID=3154805 RepID=UPI0033F02EBA